jgi:hypothetical protein
MRGADHRENIFSVVLYNHLARNTAENNLSIVVWRHRVREYVFSVRYIATVRAQTTENSVMYCWPLRALPGNGSMRHNIYYNN